MRGIGIHTNPSLLAAALVVGAAMVVAVAGPRPAAAADLKIQPKIRATESGPIQKRTCDYTATLKEPAKRAKLEAAGLKWSCKGTRCEAEGPCDRVAVSACRALADAAGPVASYRGGGGKLAGDQVERCNAGIGVAAARPGIAAQAGRGQQSPTGRPAPGKTLKGSGVARPPLKDQSKQNGPAAVRSRPAAPAQEAVRAPGRSDKKSAEQGVRGPSRSPPAAPGGGGSAAPRPPAKSEDGGFVPEAASQAATGSRPGGDLRQTREQDRVRLPPEGERRPTEGDADLPAASGIGKEVLPEGIGERAGEHIGPELSEAARAAMLNALTVRGSRGPVTLTHPVDVEVRWSF
ncbi:MAG: hypothetical protein GWO05_20875 [Gammaproteobacteria bacterium]|nr:hypothetical protein [Gammaproteobacteria bacterium]